MKSQKLYPLVLIYPLGLPAGPRFSACLKIRCRSLPTAVGFFGKDFSLLVAAVNAAAGSCFRVCPRRPRLGLAKKHFSCESKDYGI
jgi:hypothetical protein